MTFTAFSVPEGAMTYWNKRFTENGVKFEEPYSRFQEQVIRFLDSDGLRLELVAGPLRSLEKSWQAGPIPLEYAIHGFHSATLEEERFEQTASLLTQTLGFQLVQKEGNRFRYAVGSGEAGAIVDVVCSPTADMGRVAVGTVHHIAWRTADDQQQVEWHEQIARQGYNITPVIDRKYFRSVYFREPGGLLFEIATDPPGFAVDEPLESLGTKLVLPAWLEAQRNHIEADLPPSCNACSQGWVRIVD